MACPTCGHTMQGVGPGVNPATYWCPRCGTLRGIYTGPTTRVNRDDRPTLVDRCRVLQAEWMDVDDPRKDEYPPLRNEWNRLGIAEAIHAPK